MKLILKTLKQVVHEIEISSDSSKVIDVKKVIEIKLDHPINTIKLLFNGIILDDDKQLNYYSIKDNSTLILMTSKAQKKQEEPLLQNNINNNNLSNQNVPKINTTNVSSTVPINQNQPNNNREALINKYSNQITQLIEMGFDLPSCQNSIIASNGSVPIAIEYLYNGIPPNLVNSDNLNVNLPMEVDNLYDEDPQNEQFINPEMFDSINLQDPNALSNIASVIKVIIREDASMLSELLADVEEYNPEIIDFIRENESQFKTLMAQPITEDDYKIYQAALGEEGGNLISQGQNVPSSINQLIGHLNQNLEVGVEEEDEENEENDFGDDPVLEITKDFSEKDHQAIKNLESLGFNKLEAIQAYIACDRDETSAANFLFTEKNN